MAGATNEGRSQPRRRTITLSLVAAGLGVATIIVYLLLINSQTGGTDQRRVAFGASFVGLMAILSIAGAAAALGNGISQMLLLAAATGYMGIGLLSLFSIGAPLLVAGGLLFAAEPLSADHPRQNLLPATLVLVLLALGIALTS